MDYQLVVLQGRSAVKTIRLADGVTTLGRQDGCELVVRSSQVSRRHCQLFEKKGLLLVKDLGSANGTFVNGDRIEEQRVLEPGDELMVGPIKFRVEKATAAAPDAPGAVAEVKPSDTAVPEPVDAPIPLDEDDVLEFVTGMADEPESPPPAKASKPEPKAPSSKRDTATAAAKPKAPEPAPKEAPSAESAEADEAIAEFLMGIEVDEDDRR
ncbi:FHA domain-containing protein [Tautonia sociabilis]|uniref:FHA domain-containing protein n=1 Tax=Tautonia sociabilis TaxID=2080755 RepID=A0A432MGQ5_9BACT|nr:FHA domain-containing protein [Tautonia sociabilis]RUL86099.1 FHA domain-containing protein [Tautonia sociabilis]